MSYIERTAKEITDDAQTTGLRTLHKLTWMLELELEKAQPDLAVVKAFRHATEAVDTLGVIGVGTVTVDEVNEDPK